MCRGSDLEVDAIKQSITTFVLCFLLALLPFSFGLHNDCCASEANKLLGKLPCPTYPLKACLNPRSQAVDRNQYSVQFPAGVTVAKFRLYIPHVQADHSLLIQQKDLLACGEVSLPKVCAIYAGLRAAGLKHLDCFRGLDANQLRRLDASHLPFGDRHLKCFERFRLLETLWLEDTQVTNNSMSLISRLKNLAELNLSRTSVDGSYIYLLASLPKLKVLNVNGITIKRGTLLKLRPLKKTVVSLSCSRCCLASSDVNGLVQFGKLETLDISGNRLVDDRCADTISRLASLKKLIVYDTSLSARGMHKICQSRSLAFLVLRKRDWSKDSIAKFESSPILVADVADSSVVPLDVFEPLH